MISDKYCQNQLALNGLQVAGSRHPRHAMMTMTCYDDYDSEWLSLDDNNIGHAIPGYDSNGLPLESDWWHCLVNMRKVSAAAGHATDQGNYAKQQGDRSKTYLDQLDAEIDDEVKAQMIQKMLSPHVEGTDLGFEFARLE